MHVTAQERRCRTVVRRSPSEPITNRGRGVVAVQLMVVLVLLIGFAALAVDVGVMYNTRADLMNAADAAAMAGVSFFATELAREVRSDDYAGDPVAVATDEANSLAEQIAHKHSSLTGGFLILEAGDVRVGWFDSANPTNPVDTEAPVAQFNAVQVTVRRTDDSVNGAVGLFFARILGKNEANIIATATAALDDRFAGYAPQGETTPLIPFVIQEDAFADQFAFGPDEFGFDQDLGDVEMFGDGISEIHLFPYKESGDDDEVGAGNFGLLNVGLPSMGVPGLSTQIEDGITTEELLDEVGASEMMFIDSAGAPVSYVMGGTPGMKVALEASVEERVGDIVGFFLYSTLDGVAANTEYTITGLRFGRLLYTHLTGNPDDRTIVVQPIPYVGPDIIVDPAAPSTDGLLAAMMLVQ